MVDAAEQGATPARRDLTVARFLEEWLTDVLPGSVAKGTEMNDRNIVKYYVRRRLGRKHLRTLTARDVSMMLRDMEAEGLSPNIRRLARSVLRRALRWAEAEGMAQRNVAALADGVKEGKALSAEQARTFLAAIAGHRLEAAYTVDLSLGLRRASSWPSRGRTSTSTALPHG